MTTLFDTRNLWGESLLATDGVIGTVEDLYFDDAAWVIRYFVVATGSWLSSRRVLVSPISIDAPWRGHDSVSTGLTQDQIRNSPDVDTRRPLSLQHEMAYLNYYGYAYYWSGGGTWGRGAHPGSLAVGLQDDSRTALRRATQIDNAHLDAAADAEHRPHDDHHLRSCKTVMVYRVQATDGVIGHVAGYLMDATWSIRYLLVDTGHWWSGHTVLIAPRWIDAVRWDDNTLVVGLTRAAVSASPPYAPQLPLTRDQELALHRHYARDGYWSEFSISR